MIGKFQAPNFKTLRRNKTMRFGARTWLRLAEPRSGAGVCKRFPQPFHQPFGKVTNLNQDLTNFKQNCSLFSV
jgi:hypothetical protein